MNVNVAQSTPTITVSSGGLITASADGKSATKQLTTQAAKTVTPSTVSQTAVSGNVYTTGAITVGAIPSDYVKPTAKKAATTYTPGTSNQTIDSGTYLTGTQTIRGDANLIAENIKSGVSIFGINGTASGAEDLETELTQQESLISQLSSILDSKASGGSGGGSIETCTVTVEGYNDKDSSSVSFMATAYKNGNIAYLEGYMAPTQFHHVFPDIVRNTIVIFCDSQVFTDTGASCTESITPLGGNIFLINGDGTITQNPCYIKNTNITLAEGCKVKFVQDITYDDELLVWDFDNACYTSAKPLWIKKAQKTEQYYHCIFENGIVLDLVGSDGNCHAIFNIDDNCFEYANKCIGKRIMTQHGITKLISCEIKNEIVEFYNIITEYHMNCFANNILTSTKMNNIYTIHNMKFIKESRELIPYEAFTNIPIEFYKGLRLGENKTENTKYLEEKVNKILLLMKKNDMED